MRTELLLILGLISATLTSNETEQVQVHPDKIKNPKKSEQQHHEPIQIHHQEEKNETQAWPVNLNFNILDVNGFVQVQEFKKAEESSVKPPPDPVPEDTLLCHKPDFYDRYGCASTGLPGGPQPMGKVADWITLDIAKMPFNKAQWYHLDVIPSLKAQASHSYLQIKHAYVQLTDTKNRVFGRVAERVPCVRDFHPTYHFDMETWRGANISELYENPGVKNIHIFECEGFDPGWPPTVAVLDFKTPVRAFYLNFKMTVEELKMLGDQETSERVIVSTLLVDVFGACYLHRVDQLDGLPIIVTKDYKPHVPIQCHMGGPAFIDPNHDFVPLDMSRNSTVDVKNVRFAGSLGPRPKSHMVYIAKHDWRPLVDMYNLKVHGIDPLGYDPKERLEEKHRKRPKPSALRRPYLPLVRYIPVEKRQNLEKVNVKFDPDDRKCAESYRTTPLNKKHEALAMLYYRCNYSAYCMGDPVGCVKDKNCEIVVAWNKMGDFIFFEMAAFSTKFATLTLSHDDRLGNDSVTECVREGNDTVAGYTSWNRYDDEEGIIYTTRRRECVPMEEYKGGMLDRYTLFCTWKRPLTTKIRGVKWDLRKPVYVFLTAGYESTPGILGNIGKNDFIEVSDEPINLNQYIGRNPFQQWVAHLHVLLMIVTWMFVVPIGTFMSRYMKGTLVKVHILKKYTFWFGTHFMFSIISTMTTLFSVVFMLATRRGNWREDFSDKYLTWHSTLGFVISILIVFQLLFAYLMLRYKGWLSQKISFRVCHATLGHVIQYTGYACVYASRFVREGFHCDSESELMWFTICYALFHILMSYQICYSDFVLGRKTARIYRLFYIDHHQEHRTTEEGTTHNPEEEQDEPGTYFRLSVLIAYAAVLVAFNIYFMFLMWHPDAKDCVTVEALRPATTKVEHGKLFE